MSPDHPSCRWSGTGVGHPTQALGVALALVLCASSGALAQEARWAMGAQIVSARSNPFDADDIGAGARLSWRPARVLGIEVEADLYPGEFPDERAFSSRRTEVLSGVTVGPRLGRARPFVRARPGVVIFDEAPRAFPCILIYPPPLNCLMASGHSLFALDLGGGAEIEVAWRSFLTLDVGDRLLRYPGPSIDRGRRRDGRSFGHGVRLAAGGGVRF